MAFIVLLLVFGAVVAGLVPLALAIVAILTALGLVALVGTTFELSVFTINMLTGMGLALGIDYALFVVSRFREERSGGRDKLDAIAATGATASRAVLFSGCAFVIAMLGLLLIPNTIFRSLAAGAILVGMTSVAAALTLLPAVLSLLGDRVNALRIPIIGRGAERGTGAREPLLGRRGQGGDAAAGRQPRPEHSVPGRALDSRPAATRRARPGSARCPTALRPSKGSRRSKRSSGSAPPTTCRSSSTATSRARRRGPASSSSRTTCGQTTPSGRSRPSSTPRRGSRCWRRSRPGTAATTGHSTQSGRYAMRRSPAPGCSSPARRPRASTTTP